MHALASFVFTVVATGVGFVAVLLFLADIGIVIPRDGSWFARLCR